MANKVPPEVECHSRNNPSGPVLKHRIGHHISRRLQLSVIGMTQAIFFGEHEGVKTLAEGMRYREQLIAPAEEKALIARVRELPFKEFEFHGHKGKRRTVSFGWQYEFSGRGALKKANDIPEFILPLRAIAAKFAQIEPETLQHVLVVEYGPGAGIGWHRDKPVFGEVIGVSLLAPCVLRFRWEASIESRRALSSGSEADRVTGGYAQSTETKAKWKRMNLLLKPRSAYHLKGPARFEWQHSILRVDQLRYSITFRNLRDVR